MQLEAFLVCVCACTHLMLLGDGVNEEGGAHVVHVGDQDGGILRYPVHRVDVLQHTGGPVLPLPIAVHHVFKYCLPFLCWWEMELILLDQEALHLGPVAQLQKGTHTPHQSKHIELLQVLSREFRSMRWMVVIVKVL